MWTIDPRAIWLGLGCSILGFFTLWTWEWLAARTPRRRHRHHVAR